MHRPYFSVSKLFHFSPYLLLLGRIISGMGAGWRPCVIGETSRSYPRDERSKRIAILFISYRIATVIGPGINILFTNVSFQVMSLQVTYANIPGLYASALFFCIQIVSFFKLTNLSLIEDDTFHSAQSKALLQEYRSETEAKSDQIGSLPITEQFIPNDSDDRDKLSSNLTLS